MSKFVRFMQIAAAKTVKKSKRTIVNKLSGDGALFLYIKKVPKHYLGTFFIYRMARRSLMTRK